MLLFLRCITILLHSFINVLSFSYLRSKIRPHKLPSEIVYLSSEIYTLAQFWIAAMFTQAGTLVKILDITM